MIKLILAILAVIFFLLAGFKVPAAVDWTNLLRVWRRLCCCRCNVTRERRDDDNKS